MAQKECKTISGKDIRQTDERRTWRCSVKTTDGEIVTISFEVLIKLLSNYNIVVEQLRNHYRAKEITR